MISGRKNILLILSETALHLEFGASILSPHQGPSFKAKRTPLENSTAIYHQAPTPLPPQAELCECGGSWVRSPGKVKASGKCQIHVYSKIIHLIKLTTYIEPRPPADSFIFILFSFKLYGTANTMHMFNEVCLWSRGFQI